MEERRTPAIWGRVILAGMLFAALSTAAILLAWALLPGPAYDGSAGDAVPLALVLAGQALGGGLTLLLLRTAEGHLAPLPEPASGASPSSVCGRISPAGRLGLEVIGGAVLASMVCLLSYLVGRVGGSAEAVPGGGRVTRMRRSPRAGGSEGGHDDGARPDGWRCD